LALALLLIAIIQNAVNLNPSDPLKKQSLKAR